MDSILRQFASGNVNPNERRFKKDSEYERAAKALMKAEEKLLSALNENERKLYDELAAAQRNLNLLEEGDKFAQGYILGSAMTMEVMTGIDDVTL